MEFERVLKNIVTKFQEKGEEVIIGKVSIQTTFSRTRLIIRTLPRWLVSTVLAAIQYSTFSKRDLPGFMMVIWSKSFDFLSLFHASEVSFFIEKRLHPDLIMVTTQAEIDAQVARGIPVLVGHFAKRSSKEFKNYRKAANAFVDYITLGVIGDAEVDTPLNQVDVYTAGEKRSYAESAFAGRLER